MKYLAPFLLSILAFAAVALALGCGKPPAAAGGPPDDYAVRSVVALVQPEGLEERIGLVGTLQSPHTIDLVSELNARVEELLFTEGQFVTNGQVLVRLRDDHIQAQMREAEARFDLAKANFARGQDLLESQTIAQSDFDRLMAEYNIAESIIAQIQTAWADTRISSPLDGVLSERRVSAGQFLGQGQVVTTVVQLDPLEASFNVPERYLNKLANDQVIRVRTTAYGEQLFDGRVVFVDPRVDARSRTVLVKAAIPNAAGVLRPGMFVNLDLVLQINAAALLIPESAVQYRSGQAIVFVMNAADRAEVRLVVTGRRLAERVEIIDGLQAGDRVVVEGFQKMGPGVAIEISPASARYGLTPEIARPEDSAL